MYGLPLCACGATSFNDETGRCDTCQDEARIAELETEAEHLRERTTALQRDLDQAQTDLQHARTHRSELELLLQLGNAWSLNDLADQLGDGGRFHVCRADKVLPGDRLLRPLRAVTAARASLVHDDLVVLEFANGAQKEAAPAQPVAVWTPPDPHRPCANCGRPLFTGCERDCPADQYRMARLALAAKAAEWPTPGEYRSQRLHRPVPARASAVHTALRGDVTAWGVSVRLRPAAWHTGWPGIDAMFTRLNMAMRGLPESVNAAQFTVTDAPLDCRDGEWDLASAAAILTAHGRTNTDRVAGALFWARIEPDGTLRVPNGLFDDVAALAKRGGRTLVTAADGSARYAAEAVLAFATLTEAAAWIAAPPRS